MFEFWWIYLFFKRKGPYSRLLNHLYHAWVCGLNERASSNILGCFGFLNFDLSLMLDVKSKLEILCCGSVLFIKFQLIFDSNLFFFCRRFWKLYFFSLSSHDYIKLNFLWLRFNFFQYFFLLRFVLTHVKIWAGTIQWDFSCISIYIDLAEIESMVVIPACI